MLDDATSGMNPLTPDPLVSTSAGGAAAALPLATPLDVAATARRSDLSRLAAQVAWFAVLLSGVALVAYLVTSWSVLVGVVAVLTVTSVAAAILRVRLESAGLPRRRP